MDPTYVETALRAWTVSLSVAQDPARHKRPPPQLPRHLLVLDTETTTDAAQRLTFGSYRYYRLRGSTHDPAMVCVEEGLFYADDLPVRDPDGMKVLSEYASTHRAATRRRVPGDLRLMNRAEFMSDVFWKEAFRKRSLIVGFNLPFDLSRLSVDWSPARGRFHGGVSLILWDYEADDGTRTENPYRPRLAIKQIDSKRALKGFTGSAARDDIDRVPEGSEDGKPQEGYLFRGHFLDLRTLAFALSDHGHSLASACEAYGVEAGKLSVELHGKITPGYIEYNRRDVEATAELFQKAMEDYRRHPISLQPTKAYSPASIGKAYLRAIGIEPRLRRQPDFPSEVLGYAMVAYYGGRAECRIRKVPLPVVYLDFLSMYPTVNALMGLWRFQTADRILVEDRTEDVRSFVEGLTLQDCFRPETWLRLPVLVEVEPQGDAFPVRARYDPATPSWQIGVNLLEADRRWYALADVVASKLLMGKVPRILRALALVPGGAQENLAPVHLRGEVRIDPLHDDLFKTAIEERKRLAERADLSPIEQARLDRFLKVFANATSYGINAEMNRRELPKSKRERVRVYGLGKPFETTTQAPEDPGEFCFPPLAACITAGARLMLAMLERVLADHGWHYVFCDTDSMAVVATEDGGLIPCPGGLELNAAGEESVVAPSWQQLDAALSPFGGLSPYDRAVVPGSILEMERENFDPETGARRQLWCYSISAKRYALFNLNDEGEPVLRKWSEHGLGHLLNPTDPDSEDRSWIRACWEIIVRQAFHLPVQEPPWLDRPALSRISASSPHVLGPFTQYNEGKDYSDQVKPFNFLLSAQVAPFGHPEGVDPSRFHLVAPWSSDAREWEGLPWFDLYSGRQFVITTVDDFGTSGRVQVKTYRDVLAAYERHPEAKSRAAM